MQLFNSFSPVDERALSLHLLHHGQLNLEDGASSQQALVVAKVPFIVRGLLSDVVEDLLNFSLPAVDVVDLGGKLGYLLRLKLELLGLFKKRSELLLFVNVVLGIL